MKMSSSLKAVRSRYSPKAGSWTTLSNPASSSISLLSSAIPLPKWAGCVAMWGVCKCYGSDAIQIEKPAEFCETTVGVNLPSKLVEMPESLQEYRPSSVPD